MTTASSVAPTPSAGREGEVRDQFLNAGQNMSAPLQNIHDRAQARGDQASNQMSQAGQFASQFGNQAATYGGKAFDIGNTGSANAYAAGQRLEGAGGQGGAIGSQYGGRLTDAGMAGGKAIAPGQAGMYGAAERLGATADRLEGLEATQGPSAAQAQLQSATNKGQAANLAMARSGGGFGGSASRSSQALRQNAAMGQEAANQSATLKAGEDAAWRQRQAANLANAGGLQSQAGGLYGGAGQLGLGATGQNIQALGTGANAALAGNAQNIGAIQGSGQLGLGGTQVANQGAQTGIAANQAGIQGMNVGGQLAGQGATIGNQSDQLAGQAIAQDSAAKQAYNQYLAQLYGIESGVDIAQNQASNAFTGQMIGAGAAGLGMLAMSDERQKVKLSSETRGNPYGRRGAPGKLAPGTEDFLATEPRAPSNEMPAPNADQRAAYHALASRLGDIGSGVPAYRAPQVAGPAEVPGQFTALSDERQKDFRNVDAYRYRYKDPSIPGAAAGEQVGPMAQDIEKNHPDAIVESPYGKMVRQDRLVLPLSSAVGDLQGKVDRLESLYAQGKKRAA